MGAKTWKAGVRQGWQLPGLGALTGGGSVDSALLAGEGVGGILHGAQLGTGTRGGPPELCRHQGELSPE